MPSAPRSAGRPLMVRCSTRLRARLDAVLEVDRGETASELARRLLDREITRRENVAMSSSAPVAARAELDLDGGPTATTKGPAT